MQIPYSWKLELEVILKIHIVTFKITLIHSKNRKITHFSSDSYAHWFMQEQFCTVVHMRHCVCCSEVMCRSAWSDVQNSKWSVWSWGDEARHCPPTCVLMSPPTLYSWGQQCCCCHPFRWGDWHDLIVLPSIIMLFTWAESNTVQLQVVWIFNATVTVASLGVEWQ